jgi:hypothetical protein
MLVSFFREYHPKLTPVGRKREPRVLLSNQTGGVQLVETNELPRQMAENTN